MAVFSLTGEQLDDVGIKMEKGFQYFLSLPPPTGPNSGFKPFIYRSKPGNVAVVKELTFEEAFAL